MISEHEGQVVPLQRAPLNRVGLSFEADLMAVGLNTLQRETPISWGGRAAIGLFPLQQLGLYLGASFGAGTHAGDTLTQWRPFLELRAIPLVLDRAHLGVWLSGGRLFGTERDALRVHRSVDTWTWGGGALLELDLTTRLGLVLRGGILSMNGPGAPAITPRARSASPSTDPGHDCTTRLPTETTCRTGARAARMAAVASRIIHLVRHGQQERRQDDNELGPPLTEIGRRQATELGTFLATLPVGRVFCSTLTRARETAELAGRRLDGVQVRSDSDLCEVLPTRVDGMRISRTGMRKDREAALRAFARYFRPGRPRGHDVLVCHGNLIRYLLVHSLRAPRRRWLDMAATYHCAISTVEVEADGRVRLCSYNDASHIPRALRTR